MSFWRIIATFHMVLPRHHLSIAGIFSLSNNVLYLAFPNKVIAFTCYVLYTQDGQSYDMASKTPLSFVTAPFSIWLHCSD